MIWFLNSGTSWVSLYLGAIGRIGGSGRVGNEYGDRWRVVNGCRGVGGELGGGQRTIRNGYRYASEQSGGGSLVNFRRRYANYGGFSLLGNPSSAFS